MDKIVGIHQPNYLPWPGYFNKMKNVDIFVFLDTVDYAKNDFMNRNKIKTSNGWLYLTIPIEGKYYRKPINSVLLPSDDRWARNHWKTIEINYKKVPYFEKYRDSFEKIFKNLPRTLVEFNKKLILNITNLLHINVEIVKASDLSIDSELKKTDLLLEIVKKVGGKYYLSGMGARDYIEENKFKDIKLKFQHFELKKYHQLYGEWIPNLSVIDLIFNEGEKSLSIIKTGAKK